MKEQRVGRERINRREKTKEEMELWFKAVDACCKAGTERIKKLAKENNNETKLFK